MRSLIVVFLLLHAVSFSIGQQPRISVTSRPQTVWIERGEASQYLNFDFIVSNQGPDTVTLDKITLRVVDAGGKAIYTRFLDNNGTAPSIQTVPARELAGTKSMLLFNPFTAFDISIPLRRLEYEFVFTTGQGGDFTVKTGVRPSLYVQKPNFLFPLKGRVLVYDGHDFYSHHRRFDYEFAPIKALNIQANFMRYAYDFIPVDSNNNQYHGADSIDKNYVGFGQEVYAVGSGKVIYASNSHKDDKRFDIPSIARNPLELYGNCIAIEHANNTVSVYGHLMQNSIKLKAGDTVTAQQQIGKIGVSGSSFLPHLHFEMRTSIQSDAEGLPSYFSNLYAHGNRPGRKLRSGLAETGTIVDAR